VGEKKRGETKRREEENRVPQAPRFCSTWSLREDANNKKKHFRSNRSVPVVERRGDVEDAVV
jgi:hypothetical protein